MGVLLPECEASKASYRRRRGVRSGQLSIYPGAQAKDGQYRGDAKDEGCFAPEATFQGVLSVEDFLVRRRRGLPQFEKDPTDLLFRIFFRKLFQIELQGKDQCLGSAERSLASPDAAPIQFSQKPASVESPVSTQSRNDLEKTRSSMLLHSKCPISRQIKRGRLPPLPVIKARMGTSMIY